MRKFYIVSLMLFISFGGWAQLLTEPFNYTSDPTNGLYNQSAAAWTRINTGDSILVESGNLSSVSLPASTGNRVTYGGAGADYYRDFGNQASGTMYYSLLFNITSLGTLNATGGYTIGFIDNGTSNFGGNIWFRSAGANFNIGINARTTAANTAWFGTALTVNTTYFVVVSYQLVAGAGNDVVRIWINPVTGGSEPGADQTMTNTGGTDLSSIQRIFLRQDNATATPGTIQVDEIRVGNTWTSVTPSGGVGPTLSASSLNTFGNVCINTASSENSFTITGSNLTAADVTLQALSGFAYSTTSGGPYTPTLNISQPGGAFSQTVYVQFSPTAVQSYNGNIVVGGGGASDINVSATGSGVNSPPTVTTAAPTAIGATTATIPGTITANGCSSVTAYGIEYSTTNNFTPGTGTQVAGGALTGNNFSSDLTGLTGATTYYYRSYATNAGGTGYSTQSSFSTQAPEPTNHATAFACGTTTATAIPLTWTDATGGTVPTGYLIKWSSVGFGSIADPVDGTPEADGPTALNVSAGTQAGNATGLTAGTTYYFKIYPYTNNGALIDFKVDGTVPQTSCATQLPPIAAWDFTGPGNVATFTATTFDANLVSASGANNITRGAGAGASAGANSFRTTGFQNNGISTANTDYFQVTLSAQPGYELSLSSIDGNMAGTASFAAGPGGVSSQFAYSLDGTNFTLIGSPAVTVGSPAVLPTINLTGISALQNVAAGNTITLRYYASGQTTTGGWGFFSGSAGTNGLAISGSLAASSTPNLSVTSSSLTFGSLAAGGTSTSQSVDLSGVNLTGSPGNITVTSPSTDFQVSNDNSTWGPTTTIAYGSATLAATPVFVRFTPQSAGLKTGNVTFSGGGDATPPSIAVSGTGTVTYYSKAAGNITDPATWGTNTDGTGTAPANFTTDGQIFILTNRATATLDADWTVSGNGSKIQIGNGSSIDLTVPATLTITGVIDMAVFSELTLENTTINHTYGTLTALSSIEYAQAGTFNVPNTITYQTLKLTNGTKVLAGNTTTIDGELQFNNVTIDAPSATPFATLNVNANVTYTGTVVSPADGSSFTLVLDGGVVQIVTGNGNTVRVFRLTAANNSTVFLGTGTNVLAGNASSGGVEIGAGSAIHVFDNTVSTTGAGRINGLGGSTGAFVVGATSSFNVTSSSNGNSNLILSGATNNIANLSANLTGTGQLVMASNTIVNGTLTLTSGKIQVAENVTVEIPNSANLTGTLNGSNYFVTAANATSGAQGFLRIGTIPAGAFTFHVGSQSSYLPFTVNPLTTSDFTVNAFTGITGNALPNGTGFSTSQKSRLVDAVWSVSRNSGTGEVTLGAAWPAALEGPVFTTLADAQIGIASYSGTAWGSPAGSGDNTANTATRASVNSFIAFAVGQIGQVLPVNFGNVKAMQQGSGIKVDWSNLTELDVISYSIERSADGRNFTDIGEVTARLNNGGKADYSYLDANPYSGVNYYRIRSLESTGRNKLSIIVRVDLRSGITPLVLYPNPSSGGLISYQVKLAKGQYNVRIVNATGQLVHSQAVNHAGGAITEVIALPSAAKSGVYTLQITGADVNMARAFVVQ